jgi:REP element-mobilizing transposase RayT
MLTGMPRRPRLHVADGIYHVTLRGNHRQAIFFERADRDLFEVLLAESLQRCACRIHAYCWMTNHVHLAVQVRDIPLGNFVRHLASRYARTVQRRVPTTGHLFEKRYRAALVQTDAYLLALIRYIHRNPCRAGMVTDPAEYPWSGHRAYLGLARPGWLTLELGLGLLSTDPAKAREAYRRFVMTDPDAAEEAIIRRGGAEALGRPRDCHAAAGPDHRCATPAVSMTLEGLIETVAAEFGVEVGILSTPSRTRHLSRVRAMIARRALQERVATLTEIANRLGRTPATLWAGMRRYSPKVPGL